MPPPPAIPLFENVESLISTLPNSEPVAGPLTITALKSKPVKLALSTTSVSKSAVLTT